MAAFLCAARGAQFAELRRRMLELLWEGDRPMGAYELMEASAPDVTRRVAPTTVYQALEFLMPLGLVAKIESRNAYVPFPHAERHHDCLFFICNICRASAELEDQRLEHLIKEGASRIAFHALRPVVDVEGTCSTCASADAA